MMQHRVKSKDTQAMTGICQVCGPVDLKYKPSRGYSCMNAYKQNKGHVVNGYGYVSKKDREEKLLAASGKCAICQKDLPGYGFYDHCHKTREFRGLLCRSCNWGLGHFLDSPDLLKAAAWYLEKHAALEVRE